MNVTFCRRESSTGEFNGDVMNENDGILLKCGDGLGRRTLSRCRSPLQFPLLNANAMMMK